MFEADLSDMRKGVNTCLPMKTPPATVPIKQWQAAYLGLPTNQPAPNPLADPNDLLEMNQALGDTLVTVKLYMLYEKLRGAKSVEQRNDQIIRG